MAADSRPGGVEVDSGPVPEDAGVRLHLAVPEGTTGGDRGSRERHARLRELFLAACERPSGERSAFLERACGGDEELRREVESILSHDDGGVSGGDAGPGLPSDLPTAAWSGGLPPAAIGPYRLLRKIGEGGMGEVWEAEQERPVRRRVALKLVKQGMDTREVLARFESERQALALMSHPAIAKIYDAGATDRGRPWFAMEYVPGVAVTEYCDTHRLTVRERLELFLQICRGVQHAHQKGVLHRDIKPSNVLVAIEDDRPVPKIIDFGVAKATAQRLTERTLQTVLGQWIGTPEYMSPEQAGMTGLDIDTRTDVYSLGALLYELLAGSPPFAAEELRRSGLDELRRRIREEEPTRPSTRVAPEGRKRTPSRPGEASAAVAQSRRTEAASLRRALAGDLDWITLKALEKDRTRRYDSPAELAADVERYLEHRPVTAGPPSARYRFGKFIRRHRLGAAAAAVAATALIAGLVVAGFGLARARQEARISREVSNFLVGMFETLDPAAPDPATSVREILDRGAERLEEKLEDQPLVRGRLLVALGQAYGTFDLRDEARRLLEEALAIQRRQLGEGHPEVGATLDALGWTVWFQGEPLAAKSLLERAVEIRQRALGPGHPEVAESLYKLAWVHQTLGGPAAARPFAERALAIQERALGADHPDVAETLDLMGRLLQWSGDLEGSRPLLERALRIEETALGPDHVQVGWTLLQVGRHSLAAGDPVGAEQSLRRALAIHEKALGPDSGSAAADLVALARVLHKRGDDGAAREHLEHALAIYERLDTSREASAVGVLRLLAWLDSRAGNGVQARARLERALAIGEGAGPSKHSDLAPVLRDLARLDSGAGDDARARERLERALAIYERAGKPWDTYPAVLWQELALIDLRGGDHARARERLERARAIWEGEPHRRRWWLAWNAYHLACISALEGEKEEALGRLHQALDDGFMSRAAFGDPRLAPLHGDPEYEAIVAEIERRGNQSAAGGSGAPDGAGGAQ